MDSYKEKKLREEFCDILFELAKSQELFQDVHSRISIYKRLENLYGATEQNESFRHFILIYSLCLHRYNKISLLGILIF